MRSKLKATKCVTIPNDSHLSPLLFRHFTLKIQDQGHYPILLHNYNSRWFHITWNRKKSVQWLRWYVFCKVWQPTVRPAARDRYDNTPPAMRGKRRCSLVFVWYFCELIHIYSIHKRALASEHLTRACRLLSLSAFKSYFDNQLCFVVDVQIASSSMMIGMSYIVSVSSHITVATLFLTW